MDETTARSELLGRMPELHRMFRERIYEIDYETCWSLKIDFLVLAIWMFGDRGLVVEHFKKLNKLFRVVIRENNDDVWFTEDLCIAILSVDEDTWLECLDSVADHVPDEKGLSFELVICCERTMQLANMVLDRVEVITGLHVGVYGFDPSPSSTAKFVNVLEKSSPLNDLFLHGITDRFDFWSKTLKCAFHKPPDDLLGLEEARDSRLVTSLAAMGCTTTLVQNVRLYDCIIDDELMSLLLKMPISKLVFEESSRIRGDFSTVAGALASNATLQELAVECAEVCSSFAEVLSNGIANNVTLEGLTMCSLAVVPFSSICRAVGRNGSIQEAVLPVSTPMDVACMYELAQSPSLQELTLQVDDSDSRIFYWSGSALSSFLRAKPTLKRLKVSGCSETNDPSDDDLCMISQSLADNTSLAMFDLDIPSHRQTWKGYAEFVSGLGCNTSLVSLKFGTSPDPDTFPSRMAFEHAMERNYGLMYVGFNREDSRPVAETICKLNAAGRIYMLTDPTSRVKGVDVLSHVINNLDRLFITFARIQAYVT